MYTYHAQDVCSFFQPTLLTLGMNLLKQLGGATWGLTRYWYLRSSSIGVLPLTHTWTTLRKRTVCQGLVCFLSPTLRLIGNGCFLLYICFYVRVQALYRLQVLPLCSSWFYRAWCDQDRCHLRVQARCLFASVWWHPATCRCAVLWKVYINLTIVSFKIIVSLCCFCFQAPLCL